MVESAPGFGNGGRVAEHAHGAVDGSELATRDAHRCSQCQLWVVGDRLKGLTLLIVDAKFEPGRAPFDEVEAGLGLESRNCCSAVTRDDIATVEQRHSHVFAVSRIADHHLVVGFEALEGQVVDFEALVTSTVGRDDGCIADERIMDARVGNQVGLELVQVDIEGAVESQAGRYRADDLGNEAVEVFVVGARDVKVSAADVVDSFIVHKESTVRVLDRAVGGEDGVVRLDDRGGDTRCGVDGELKLALFAVVGGEAFQKKCAETRACTTAEGMEDEEALERGTVVWKGKGQLGGLGGSR